MLGAYLYKAPVCVSVHICVYTPLVYVQRMYACIHPQSVVGACMSLYTPSPCYVRVCLYTYRDLPREVHITL